MRIRSMATTLKEDVFFVAECAGIREFVLRPSCTRSLGGSPGNAVKVEMAFAAGDLVLVLSDYNQYIQPIRGILEKVARKKGTYTRRKTVTASTTVVTTIKASEMANLLKVTAGDEERGREEEKLNETFTKRRY